jgi:hypothetical protein
MLFQCYDDIIHTNNEVRWCGGGRVLYRERQRWPGIEQLVTEVRSVQ